MTFIIDKAELPAQKEVTIYKKMVYVFWLEKYII
jgi:hypothetical protein